MSYEEYIAQAERYVPPVTFEEWLATAEWV